MGKQPPPSAKALRLFLLLASTAFFAAIQSNSRADAPIQATSSPLPITASIRPATIHQSGRATGKVSRNVQATASPAGIGPLDSGSVLIDFEHVPTTFYARYGRKNLSGFYPGVTFGNDVTILDAIDGGYNSNYYPAHSGTAVAFSGTDPVIYLRFDTPVKNVSFWYTTAFAATATAYLQDGSSEVRALSPNYGSNGQVVFSSSNIIALRIDQPPNYFDMDDLAFTSSVQISRPVIGVGPLLSTSWHQGFPFNNLCPTFAFDPSHPGVATVAPAGCVAIAISQLMRYHQYPAQGASSHNDIFAFGGGTQLPGDGLFVDFSKEFYNWGNMPDYVIDTNDDVQRLVRDVGVAVDMDYFLTESSSTHDPVNNVYVNLAAAQSNNWSYALEQYFRFQSGGTLLQRSDYPSFGAWFNRLRAEIDAGRPVLYRIKCDLGGHLVVMDGYRVRGDYLFIHLNFGWDNDANRWYPIDEIVDPIMNKAWTSEQAVVGISPRPDSGQNPVPVLTGLSPSTVSAGAGAVTITLSGTGFSTQSKVIWHGYQPVELVTSLVSPSRLLAIVPATLTAAGPGAQISVVNPSPGGGTSSPAQFSVVGTPRLVLSAAVAHRASNGQVVVDFAIANYGTDIANSVRITSARLTGTNGATANLNTVAGNIAAGSTYWTSATFPASVTRATRLLQIYGVMNGTAFSISHSIDTP